MRYTIAFEFTIALFVLTGCASGPPANFVEGVPWMAAQRKIVDAKSQQVAGLPCLRMDAALLDR